MPGETGFDGVRTAEGLLHPSYEQVTHWYSAGAQTTGVKKNSMLIGRAGTIVAVQARLDTAPVGSTFIVDLNINGTTAFTTQGNRPTIADGANLSSATLPDVVAVAAGDRLSYDVDQIGSGTAGSDLYLTITIKRPTVA